MNEAHSFAEWLHSMALLDIHHVALVKQHFDQLEDLQEYMKMFLQQINQEQSESIMIALENKWKSSTSLPQKLPIDCESQLKLLDKLKRLLKQQRLSPSEAHFLINSIKTQRNNHRSPLKEIKVVRPNSPKQQQKVAKFDKQRAANFFQKIQSYQQKREQKLRDIMRQRQAQCTYSPRVNEKSKRLAQRSREQNLYNELERRLQQRNIQLLKQ